MTKSALPGHEVPGGATPERRLAATVNNYTFGTRAPTPTGAGRGVAFEGEEPTSPDAASPRGETAEPMRLDFEQVYTSHFDFVCRSLRLLGVPAEGLDDAAQDVFGVVSRRLEEFVQKASIKTWIFAVTQRVASNHRRALRRKQRSLEPLGGLLSANEPSPEALAEGLQAAALVQSFAAGLDEGHRAVLVLGLLERMPARELAAELGIPVNTVYSRMRSVREGLRVFLAEHEVDT